MKQERLNIRVSKKEKAAIKKAAKELKTSISAFLLLAVICFTSREKNFVSSTKRSK